MSRIAYAFQLSTVLNRILPKRIARLWKGQKQEAAPHAVGGVGRRAKIHHIYYVLAIFDLAAIVTGLSLTHHINGVLSDTVHANLGWSALHDRVADLRSGAGLVNAPGNDVFASKNAAQELKTFDEAVAAFWPHLLQLRKDIVAKVPGEAAVKPADALDRLELAMGAMVRQTRTLLSLYAGGDVGAAGAAMSMMDRSYSDVLTQIETISQVLRRIESDKGVAELENSKKLQFLEHVLGFAVIFIVVAVTVYGHKLGRLIQRQYDSLSSYNDMLKQQDEKLQAQNVQLDAALNNMAQGLAMFDAGQRLIVCNDRYAEMYGLTPEQVKPGTTLQQILEYRIANDHIEGRTTDELLESMLTRVPYAGGAGYYTTRLGDGRCIAVAVQPMSDGGRVTTYQDITEQRRSEAKIAHMALHDTLTGLPNRALFNERLEHALTRVSRGEIVATHLLDLDHFKNVNDTLGHPVGDKLLTMVADRLRTLVRETDTIARMGGDEFALIQVGIAQPSDATILAERIIEVVSRPYDIDGQQVVIGTSIGIAMGPADGSSPDQLMRNADLALYRSKGQGRGVCRFFEPEMDEQMQTRRVMENDLRKALISGEFELHYQPVVNLNSNEVSGVEALIRWHHPEKGMISPGEFIPLAEENGFIIPLGEWALKSACNAARDWPDNMRVAVNISPVQFRKPGLVQTVVSALATAGLPAERLELEITEAVLLEDNDATLAMLHQLRELGVRIAMDDFGTGYSSLSYLQRFPFDKIKIDRSFINGMADGASSRGIIRAIAALANGLGMATTAEGVETQQQRDAVKSEGCTEMQGFLFSKPLTDREMKQLLQSEPAKTAYKGAVSAA